jgi:hypothetical protein
MKKYRLIREYPDSPEIGTEIIKSHISNSSLGNYDTYMIKGEGWFKLSNPQDYPEFWQKVVEKDYEILRFILPSNNIIHVQHVKNSIKFMLKNPNTYKIYSVKRLSDGEIFTIGDKVTFNNINSTIEAFRLEIEAFYVDFKSGNGVSIKYVEKAKQPLFKTEDGVDIFEHDRFWNVDLKFNFKKQEFQITNNKYSLEFLKNGSKQFSTKEKAEEYIIMNKPCLSLNDIATIYKGINKKTNHPSSQANQLKNLVKQKLNNNN